MMGWMGICMLEDFSLVQPLSLSYLSNHLIIPLFKLLKEVVGWIEIYMLEDISL